MSSERKYERLSFNEIQSISRLIFRRNNGRPYPISYSKYLSEDCKHPQVVKLKNEIKKKEKLKIVKDPTSRFHAGIIRPLRSKPDPRKKSKIDKKNIGPKLKIIKTDQIYFENGWHICGFCNIYSITEHQFSQHISSNKHNLQVSLSPLKNIEDCKCGKKFGKNKLHLKRHLEACAEGKYLI